MFYWVLRVSGKVVARNKVQHMIYTGLIYPAMKWGIDKFDEELEKRLDGTNYVNDVGSGLYIEKVDGSDETAHEDVSNTPSDETYG